MIKLPTNIERHVSHRGNTGGEVTWRVWNPDHTFYTPFKTRRDALAYAIPPEPEIDQAEQWLADSLAE